MTAPVTVDLPPPAPDKYAGNPAAFDAQVQTFLGWLVNTEPQRNAQHLQNHAIAQEVTQLRDEVLASAESADASAQSASASAQSASASATSAGDSATQAQITAESAASILRLATNQIAQANGGRAEPGPEIFYSAAQVMVPDTTVYVAYPNASGLGNACTVYQKPASMSALAYVSTYEGTTTWPMQTFGRVVISGSIRVDAVYIRRYSFADCSLLFAAQDLVYFPGSFAEYQCALSGSSFIRLLKIYADGRIEGAAVSDGATEGARDWLIFRDGQIRTDALKAALVAGTPPVLDGSVLAPETPPASAFVIDSGWPSNVFFADGRAISRADYPLLFSQLGTRHGAGDGSTTFNLPPVDPSDKSATPHSGVAGVYAYIKP